MNRDYEKLYGDFAESFKKAHEGKDGLKLWPNDFCDFLGTKMQALFTMNAYILNPENIQDVDIGDIARPQTIPTGAAPLEFDPFKNLVRVDIISAQRGLDDSDDADESPMESSLLSDQLRSYYDRQLDPEHEPSASDLKALKELQGASEVFNQQISKKFHKAMKELSQFGYVWKVYILALSLKQKLKRVIFFHTIQLFDILFFPIQKFRIRCQKNITV